MTDTSLFILLMLSVISCVSGYDKLDKLTSIELSDELIKNNLGCAVGIPSVCLQKKIVSIMNEKTFKSKMYSGVDICQDRNLWASDKDIWDYRPDDVKTQKDGKTIDAYVLAFLTSLEQLKECNKYMLRQELAGYWLKSFSESYDQTEKVLQDSKLDLSSVKTDYSVTQIAKISTKSVAYDTLISVPGKMGETICDNADTTTWQWANFDVKLQICGNIHLGLKGQLDMSKDYNGTSRAFSLSMGPISLSVQWPIKSGDGIFDEVVDLDKPTFQICWDAWSISQFTKLKSLANVGKIRKMMRVLIGAMRVGKNVASIQKLLPSVGTSRCVAKLDTYLDFIIKRPTPLHGMMVYNHLVISTIHSLIKSVMEENVSSNIKQKGKGTKKSSLNPSAQMA